MKIRTWSSNPEAESEDEGVEDAGGSDEDLLGEQWLSM